MINKISSSQSAQNNSMPSFGTAFRLSKSASILNPMKEARLSTNQQETILSRFIKDVTAKAFKLTENGFYKKSYTNEAGDVILFDYMSRTSPSIRFSPNVGSKNVLIIKDSKMPKPVSALFDSLTAGLNSIG